MHVATYIAIAIRIKTKHTYACSSALSSTKTFIQSEPFKAHVTAELYWLSVAKCQFIHVKQEQASEKLEKTTIPIVEPSVLSS